ncbi:flagellar protein [Hoeflea ulvae]|uniref:Flagellar protein n=1 Tax=Hoeflea ulvae TaxID=2983764 RepID=A0ABT3YCK0_9HYPH|nr:flagellar protein [Hoeflea ulvae]MCY0093509.1 flagellar protein [Hoeflea ulvae]
MTDQTDIEEEAPEPGPARRRQTGDRVFVVTGFLLATAAAFFPWYVFFNQESFGIAPMGYTETRDLPDIDGRAMVNVSPLAIPATRNGPAPASAFDPITTATVPGSEAAPKSLGAAAGEDPNLSFPGNPRYRLLHVANGRALIEDKTGMYIVRIGSVLPDNSRLARLEEREGSWVIVTSNGDVIER